LKAEGERGFIRLWPGACSERWLQRRGQAIWRSGVAALLSNEAPGGT